MLARLVTRKEVITVTELMAPTETSFAAADTIREEAIRVLKKKREFHEHLLAFILVNAFLWAIWGVVYIFGGPVFPWPIIPLLGWGIGLTFHAWDAFGRKPFSEEEIQREAQRLAS
jgi:2TM domain